MEKKVSSETLEKLESKDSVTFNSKVLEELAELSVEYAHYISNKTIPEHVIGEVADVIIQLNKVMWKVEQNCPEAYKILRFKLADKIGYLDNLAEEM